MKKSLFKINKKTWFYTGLYLVLLTAFIFRIYNLPDRIGLGSDSTRDVIIAQEALKRGELPLIGSFSSAGPFVFGPLFYWFNMMALTLLPFSFKTPWILMTLVGLLTVVVMMKIGYLLEGRRLSIVLGLIAAFCPQFISRSTGLSQHSLVGITTALAILFFILLYQRKKLIFSFLMGISVGTAVSMHYQAINLFIFLPVLFLVPKLTFKKKVLSSCIFFAGFIIPSIPIIYWDSQQNFANANNILDYIFIAQHRIYVPNSWKLYIFMYLPDYWSNVVGGNKPIAFLIMCTTFFVFTLQSLKAKIKGEVFLLGLILWTLLFVIRYYKGERFDGYMIYTAPFIFLISGWALVNLYDIVSSSRYVKNSSLIIRKGFLFFSLAVFAAILSFDLLNASRFILVNNDHEEKILHAKNTLVKKYPDEKFQLYDYYWRTSDITYYLGVLLEKENRIDKNGMPIGIVLHSYPYNSENNHVIYNYNDEWIIRDLSDLPQHIIRKPEWSPANPSDIYDDLMKWQKTEKLTSTFSLQKYLEEKLLQY